MVVYQDHQGRQFYFHPNKEDLPLPSAYPGADFYIPDETARGRGRICLY